ncbi:acetyltransferase [Arthrobacter sp. CDRTa11]|uniref:GNAT family N-acetyltransferase n=1 Tax=Arthrobacter sp. CDRTa11 TaxID=2651199 RepID=UPI002265D0D0|nr:GNAT family N-acetyltransferase [Arthrobacter sp. CDRTa11]UZX02849.1 acetyltransferase [Arthrobacter sp. CDRTa11]
MTPVPAERELFQFRSIDPVLDADILHSWVTQERSRFWGMLAASRQDVENEYRQIAGLAHHDAFLGLEAGVPAFLMERYLPALSPLCNVYSVERGDVGMHFLVGPPCGGKRHGYTLSVLKAIMEKLFSDLEVERIVVEPDIRNHKVHALNAKVGFRPRGTVTLPAVEPFQESKQALLGFCSRRDFLATFSS